ncbi:hypothetical protein ABWH96_04640 [Marivirga tractuosa]|uniref:hypothetical protein n=1 Tax=Marivirga tractuosa TaxID=1006 RepID=UPI0035CEF834
MKILYLFIIFLFASACNKNNHRQTEKRSDKNQSKESLAQKQLMIANEFYEKDQFEKSAKEFTNTIRLDSTIGEAYFKLAYSLALTKKTLYEEAKEKNKKMTLEFINQKDTSATTIINNFIKAAQLNYRPSASYYNAGIYTSTFHLDGSSAIKLFNKSLELKPNQPEVILMIENIKKDMEADSSSQVK